MVQVLVLVVVACTVAVMAGRSSASIRWLAPVGVAVFIYFVSVVGWWWMLYFHVVSFDSMLARFHTYRAEGLLGLSMYFGPPLLPVAAFALASRHRALRRRN